jgi:hypothetical protein
MLAEALARLEQELVHRVAPEQPRLGGVLQALDAEVLDPRAAAPAGRSPMPRASARRARARAD